MMPLLFVRPPDKKPICACKDLNNYRVERRGARSHAGGGGTDRCPLSGQKRTSSAAQSVTLYEHVASEKESKC
jgi:hypothetical protein